MSTEQIIGLLIALLVMAVGVAGSLLPGIPSTPLILVAAIGHKLHFGPESVGWIAMTTLVLITAASLVMDFLTTLFGARVMGATWRGAAGAVVGGIIGLFFNLPGILIGPFVGAIVFELAGGRTAAESARAGVGATVGLLAGVGGKLICCAAMISLFTASVLYHSLA